MNMAARLFLLLVTILAATPSDGAEVASPNFLIITADDLNWDSVGCYGCPLTDVTPGIDRLASSGIRFEHAHVAAAVCQPSRSAISTGRRGHRSGGEGFFHLRFPDIPTVQGLLHEHGYRVGILGKVAHSTPYADTPWDMAKEMGRDTDEFEREAAKFIDTSVSAAKPFYLIVNSHDPHRPYFRIDRRNPGTGGDVPSRIYQPEEIPANPSLPDHPDVRHEQACYFSSVRRCDDVVDRVVRLIEDRQLAENTMIVFLSDHGMAVPSAKANCYLQSTRTPLIVRWDGHISPGTVDTSHMVSSMDILPTLLEAAQIENPGGMDGRSLLPLFRGEPQQGRDHLFTQFYMKIGNMNYQMRAVVDRESLFVFNPWHNGKPVYNTSSLGGNTFRSMLELGASDPDWAARCDHVLTRAPEEFFDLRSDPQCVVNLIDDSEYQPQIDRMKSMLSQHLIQSDDPMRAVFEEYQKTRSVEDMMRVYLEMWTLHDLPGKVASRPVNTKRWTEPRKKRAGRRARRAADDAENGKQGTRRRRNRQSTDS